MPRVSVIVPAYNAQATIDETLASVSAQTMSDLEIIVVADGCTDMTVERVERRMSTDPRIRLIEQSNAGVAAARNAGIAVAVGAFVAPLDADDLWHPRKLERQIERFVDGGDDLGLVYNWYHPIDDASYVCGTVAAPRIEGQVLHRHLHWNFIGNGSTPLIRIQALDGLAYDGRLRAANAGGCEDYLLQLQIALRWRFACVPAHLTGYRQRAGAMSANRGVMMRSHVFAFRTIRRALPNSALAVCDASIARFEVLSASAGLRDNGVTSAVDAVVRAMRSDGGAAVGALIDQIGTIWRARGRGAAPSEPNLTSFLMTPAVEQSPAWIASPSLSRLSRLDDEVWSGLQKLRPCE